MTDIFDDIARAKAKALQSETGVAVEVLTAALDMAVAEIWRLRQQLKDVKSDG